MKIDHAEIKKRISVFALSLIIIHRIILLAAKGTPIASRTCVETEDNVYFCTDDLQEAREKSKKTHRYYLDNFGARQTIVGNSKDMEKMRIWESDMEVYLRKFIEERGDGEEWLKELCTNQHKNCIFWASKGECKSNPDLVPVRLSRSSVIQNHDTNRRWSYYDIWQILKMKFQ
eukprot:scaffold7133_cov119-Skeletonema_marinoi.AAC.3